MVPFNFLPARRLCDDVFGLVCRARNKQKSPRPRVQQPTSQTTDTLPSTTSDCAQKVRNRLLSRVSKLDINDTTLGPLCVWTPLVLTDLFVISPHFYFCGVPLLVNNYRTPLVSALRGSPPSTDIAPLCQPQFCQF